MPKRTDIDAVMIIGAGPIVIGQACEFDYSGTQACKALKQEGYRVVLVNSNPATIMTDPNTADATYIEPITPDIVAKILKRERQEHPDEKLVLLPTMGGQTALNTALALEERGVLELLGVEMIGAKADVIDKAEDRQRFREAMDKIGLESPRSKQVSTLEEAMVALDYVKLPTIIRPSFTMGGTGGGIAYNKEEFQKLVKGGLAASPVHTVLVEESVLGWKEYEMEVVRDRDDNCIIICSIENFDPMGVHTGDSITVAPALTLTDKEYQIMRNASIACLREIGVETGGSNVQFAVNPDDGRLVVIEMNPRVSRSSALASKATGFPIAKVAAKLAVGYTLDELDNDITKVTPASFEPTIDYVVTKMPRFTFEKFAGADPTLTTSMKSVGEAMSIGRTFAESLQKALRSMETGLTGLNEIDIGTDKDAWRAAISKPLPDRLLKIAQAFRHGMTLDEIHRANNIDPWFLAQIETIVKAEQGVRDNGLPKSRQDMLRLKKLGFSDMRLAELAGTEEGAVMALRHELDVRPVYKRIDTCAAEFPSETPYMYSCYEGDGFSEPDCEADVTDRKKVVILGGGPNRIGQGIEFDYCCVHAAYALTEAGYETIMVNCNPETVSTDYDTSDRLYFEPLTGEDVIELVRKEQAKGEVLGVIVQFGGQTPLKLAGALEAAGIPILGTSPDAIDLAEDRERFQKLIQELDLLQPPNGIAVSEEQAVAIAKRIGFPVVIRPSYVLGGRAMEIVHGEEELRRYINSAVQVSGKSPVLIDYYLKDAIEVDVDALCDGETVHVAGVMEHIEEAGIHSGDSACSLPPYSLPQSVIDDMKRQTEAMAKALGVVGLMNVQYAVKDGTVYILEVNPRASRTVPFVAKATGVPIAKIASRIMAGEKLADFDLEPHALGDHIAVKEAVFPFNRFPGVDVILGPEMKSTGEVMGLDKDFAHAFAKAQFACGADLPSQGKVFVSVKDSDKTAVLEPSRMMVECGLEILATAGTARYLEENGVPVTQINKVMEGQPHIVDAIINGDVQLVFNTTEGRKALEDSFSLRQAALSMKVPYYTTVAGVRAAALAIRALKQGGLEVAPLQSYFSRSA
ncbi:carbamoyl-phosphate synthase large subunit [Rhodospirillaceae bacterium KN72]|uniref:Carbamoyl phosphate synthase large chain n=1 Tax=Pacificispira spongiicola TaxID=2729598 RepID=A0A7Y0DYB7_9PROT|nr:carbamoyl-phosphate synthase large subunit [Pacificispira spongiicola]NMM43844.1 carbamoyl-phosphate synthase large subunit [Pacificispira spongiicola]